MNRFNDTYAGWEYKPCRNGGQEEEDLIQQQQHSSSWKVASEQPKRSESYDSRLYHPRAIHQEQQLSQEDTPVLQENFQPIQYKHGKRLDRAKKTRHRHSPQPQTRNKYTSGSHSCIIQPVGVDVPWDEARKADFARRYERLKPEIWKRIGLEMGLPWRAVEAQHWAMGRDETERRGTCELSQQSQPLLSSYQSAVLFRVPAGTFTCQHPSQNVVPNGEKSGFLQDMVQPSASINYNQVGFPALNKGPYRPRPSSPQTPLSASHFSPPKDLTRHRDMPQSQFLTGSSDLSRELLPCFEELITGLPGQGEL